MRTSASNLKKGDFVLHQNNIWQVAKTEFSFQGRGMAVVRTKFKNVSSQKSVDFTFKSNEELVIADVATTQMQFLYKDNNDLFFMNEKTYNQYSIDEGAVGVVANFLKPGEKYFIILYADKPVSIRPPASVKLKVVEAEEAVKGDTVSGAKKQAKVETGVSVVVPLFIKVGDTIVVNPETGEYMERSKS